VFSTNNINQGTSKASFSFILLDVFLTYPTPPKPIGGCGIRRIASLLSFEDVEGFAGEIPLLEYLEFRNPHSEFRIGSGPTFLWMPPCLVL
jgi:hypothetical protein